MAKNLKEIFQRWRRGSNPRGRIPPDIYEIQVWRLLWSFNHSATSAHGCSISKSYQQVYIVFAKLLLESTSRARDYVNKHRRPFTGVFYTHPETRLANAQLYGPYSSPWPNAYGCPTLLGLSPTWSWRISDASYACLHSARTTCIHPPFILFSKCRAIL